jgi:hypothetical protein
MNDDIRFINKTILDRYGFDYMRRPIFRVAWTTNQLETRLGEHEVFYGTIYLRTDFGVYTLPKYQFAQDRWVLERLFPNNPEVTGIQSDHTYEALYVFENKDGSPQDVNLRAVNYICWHAMNPGRRMIASDFKERERKELEAEINHTYELLDDKSPYLSTMVRNGEAVFMPSRRFNGPEELS